MPLLGSGAAFSIGTSGSGDPSMGKSLDEMIKDRRMNQTKESKRGPKKASVADRSIASGRAKREAAMKARRGLSQSKKATAMDIEEEVSRQKQKTAKAKKNKEKKATGGRIAPDSTARNAKKNEKKKAAAKKNSDPPAIFGGRVPSKKAVEAAIKGMASAGFKVPQGHQVVMTFVPSVASPTPTKKADPKGKKGNKPAPGGRRKK